MRCRNGAIQIYSNEMSSDFKTLEIFDDIFILSYVYIIILLVYILIRL